MSDMKVIEGDKAMAEIQAMQREQEVIRTDLLKVNPTLPHITASIMANDIWMANKYEVELRAGRMDYDDALIFCGSFSRLDAAVRWQEAGFATRDHLLDILPDEWPSSDPDDTDPRFARLWIEAWVSNGRKPVYDQRPPRGKGLPRTKTIRVYRGQPAGAPIGLSWSLDPDVAQKFAKGAWARIPVGGGEVIQMDARRDLILAYLSGRQESEVIIDPRTVARLSPSSPRAAIV